MSWPRAMRSIPLNTKIPHHVPHGAVSVEHVHTPSTPFQERCVIPSSPVQIACPDCTCSNCMSRLHVFRLYAQVIMHRLEPTCVGPHRAGMTPLGTHSLKVPNMRFTCSGGSFTLCTRSHSCRSFSSHTRAHQLQQRLLQTHPLSELHSERAFAEVTWLA